MNFLSSRIFVEWLWLEMAMAPFVNDSKFCRKLQWSQIVEFFSFNYLHACVEKNYRSF